jgi:hypothetical protein
MGEWEQRRRRRGREAHCERRVRRGQKSRNRCGNGRS